MAGQDGLFSRHRESVSGLLDSPRKQSADIIETVNYFSGPLYQKPSDSGLLVPGLGRHNIGKEAGEQPLPLSNKVNLSRYSKPSPTLFSGNRKGNPAPLRPRDAIQAPKSLGLSNGSSESKRLNDKKHHSQKNNLSKTENGKVCLPIETYRNFCFVSLHLLLFPSFPLPFCFTNYQQKNIC